jgi:GT2 family glycosyltransferase
MTENRLAPLVIIVTVNYRSLDNTVAALQTFVALDYPRFEVVLVDNGSGDDTPTVVRRQFPRVNVIVSETNLGFAGGYNLGIEWALARGADAVLVINNDVLAPPNLLSVLTRYLTGSIGAVSPVIYYADRRDVVWSSGFRRNRWTLEMTGGHRGATSPVLAAVPFEVDYLLGCAMLLSREALATTGGFDPRFFLYYEDLDLCLRLQRAGYRLLTAPEAALWHKVAGSTGLESPCRTYHLASSSVMFFRKHARGRSIPAVLLWRSASAYRKILAFAARRRPSLLRAYLHGLADGWSGCMRRAARYCGTGQSQ